MCDLVHKKIPILTYHKPNPILGMKDRTSVLVLNSGFYSLMSVHPARGIGTSPVWDVVYLQVIVVFPKNSLVSNCTRELRAAYCENG